MKAIKHFQTITKHKILVMQECFRVGLYRQGLLHDLSKYGWTEFRVGCRYYQGTRSPNNAEREDKGYSSAWLHHKGRNKHHYEYWLDYDSHGEGKLVGMKMPVRYVVEMFMDRIAACKVYKGAAYKDSDPNTFFSCNFLISHSYVIYHVIIHWISIHSSSIHTMCVKLKICYRFTRIKK